MTKVSVIVPVYNPGADIDPLIDSLLGQTMPAGERELVFVDDGSTDGTGARLDALADRARRRPGGAHPELRLARQAPQRRPRPRRGRVRVLRRQRRLARARRARAPVRGRDDAPSRHRRRQGGGPRPRGAAHLRRGPAWPGRAARPTAACSLPTSSFAGRCSSSTASASPRAGLASRTTCSSCPPISRRSGSASCPRIPSTTGCTGRGASHRRPDPGDHFESVRELLAMVDDRTAPGETRDRYYLHWYRGKVLKRLGRATVHQRDREYRAQVFEAARQLIDERFPPRLDDGLAYSFRLRARLARRGDLEGLERLAAFENGLRGAGASGARRERGSQGGPPHPVRAAPPGRPGHAGRPRGRSAAVAAAGRSCRACSQRTSETSAMR